MGVDLKQGNSFHVLLHIKGGQPFKAKNREAQEDINEPIYSEECNISHAAFPFDYKSMMRIPEVGGWHKTKVFASLDVSC